MELGDLEEGPGIPHMDSTGTLMVTQHNLS